MSTLCILANEFPYGSWEPYLETEIKYYFGFDKIWICSLQLRDEHAKTIRKTDTISEVFPVRYVSRVQYLIESIVVLFDINFYKELVFLFIKKRLNIRTIVSLVVFLSRAHHEAKVINLKVKDNNKDNIVFYSYRFEYQPYVAILLKKKWKSNGIIVSRAHRYDLYEEQHRENYIPLRKTILSQIDRVFPCSEDGMEYLKERFPEYSNKIMVSYLGTKDNGIGPKPSRCGFFHIVSCSNVVPVKRVNKIVEALSRIDDINIVWTHFGDGPLLSEVVNMANKLPENIKADFRGSVNNSDIIIEYKEHPFDLFINVSSSEGIPVSIMEALSFGIPCIATDVGGTKEIITNDKGSILLKENISSIELSYEIRRFCEMEYEEYMRRRQESRKLWEKKFNSDENYKNFSLELSSFSC